MGMMMMGLTPLLVGEQLTVQQRNALLMWLGVLMGVVILGFVGLIIFRRKITADEAGSSADVGFSLSDLRKMRDRGEITSEEYERTRAKVVASVKRMVDEPPKKGSAFPKKKEGDEGLGTLE